MFANRLTTDMYPQGKRVSFDYKRPDQLHIGWDSQAATNQQQSDKAKKKQPARRSIEGDYRETQPEELERAVSRYDSMRKQSRAGEKGQIAAERDLQSVRASIIRQDRVGELFRAQQSPYREPASIKSTKRNNSTFELGNGYNCFRNEGDRPTPKEFHSKIVDQYHYNVWQEQHRISNIQFG